MRRQLAIAPYDLTALERGVFQPTRDDGNAHPLEDLARAVELRVAAEAYVDECVARCRQPNSRELWGDRRPRHTWEQIAQVLRVSKQAVAKRYGDGAAAAG
jgi:hypothetical protein